MHRAQGRTRCVTTGGQATNFMHAPRPAEPDASIVTCDVRHYLTELQLFILPSSSQERHWQLLEAKPQLLWGAKLCTCKCRTMAH
jgi:hypothetical protein